MRKKLICISSLILISLIILTTTVYAAEPINPINNVYKEGIYKLSEGDKGEYDLKFQFINSNKNSSIIVLNENSDIVYKNINCNRRCNAGVITNKNTIVIITDGEVQLYFTKIK